MRAEPGFAPDQDEDVSQSADFRQRKERRSEVRLRAHLDALARVVSPAISERFRAEIIDVSSHGAKIRCLRELVPGTMIQLRTENNFLLGEIRYCLEADDVFEAGLRIEDTH